MPQAIQQQVQNGVDLPDQHAGKKPGRQYGEPAIVPAAPGKMNEAQHRDGEQDQLAELGRREFADRIVQPLDIHPQQQDGCADEAG